MNELIPYTGYGIRICPELVKYILFIFGQKISVSLQPASRRSKQTDVLPYSASLPKKLS